MHPNDARNHHAKSATGTENCFKGTKGTDTVCAVMDGDGLNFYYHAAPYCGHTHTHRQKYTQTVED